MSWVLNSASSRAAKETRPDSKPQMHFGIGIGILR
jgi:hypothetical protein